MIPARNAAGTLGAALQGVNAQQLDGGFEVIVVDDGSSDDTAEVARRMSATVLEQASAGPAAARNLGARAALSRNLAFLDADCVPAPGWLAAGLAALGRSDLVQGRVLPDPGVGVGPFDRTLWVLWETGLYETANLFVSRQAFDHVGGFEDWLRPRLGKAMAEDVWLGWRIRRAGFTTAFGANALVHHAVFPRSPAGYVAERARLEHFPELVAKVPELRGSFCFARWFLNRRSAAFDLAVAGALVALVRRHRWALVASLPWLAIAGRRASRFGRRAPVVLAVDAAADAVGLAALAVGSVRSRSPLA